jgi:hypothetical protein
MPDQIENTKCSGNDPAFEGEYEFDLTIEMRGRRITRKARALYTHTPRWEYFDLKKNALCIADIPEMAFELQILAMPKEFHADGTITDEDPYWVTVNDIMEDNLFPALMIALCDAIDDQCMFENERPKEQKKRESTRRH